MKIDPYILPEGNVQIAFSGGRSSMVREPQYTGQFSKRYSRAEMRDQINQLGPYIFDIEGFHCQADDGECVE